jgi:hypothetical protein
MKNLHMQGEFVPNNYNGVKLFGWSEAIRTESILVDGTPGN